MPWSPMEFKNRHNKKLSKGQAEKAAAIANAVRAKGNSDASSIRIANAKIKESIKKNRRKRSKKPDRGNDYREY